MEGGGKQEKIKENKKINSRKDKGKDIMEMRNEVLNYIQEGGEKDKNDNYHYMKKEAIKENDGLKKIFAEPTVNAIQNKTEQEKKVLEKKKIEKKGKSRVSAISEKKADVVLIGGKNIVAIDLKKDNLEPKGNKILKGDGLKENSESKKLEICKLGNSEESKKNLNIQEIKNSPKNLIVSEEDNEIGRDKILFFISLIFFLITALIFFSILFKNIVK